MKFISFQMIANMSGKFQISPKDIQILHNKIRYLQLKFKLNKYTSGNTKRNSDTLNLSIPLELQGLIPVCI